MLGYVVVMLVGMSLYGVEAWTRNADPFGVYFGLFAVARAARRGATACSTRGRRPSAPDGSAVPGVAAVLVAGIGVTAFDGASEGPLFNDVLPDLQEFFGDLGFGAGARRSSSASRSGCSSASRSSG